MVWLIVKGLGAYRGVQKVSVVEVGLNNKSQSIFDYCYNQNIYMKSILLHYLQ